MRHEEPWTKEVQVPAQVQARWVEEQTLEAHDRTKLHRQRQGRRTATAAWSRDLVSIMHSRASVQVDETHRGSGRCCRAGGRGLRRVEWLVRPSEEQLAGRKMQSSGDLVGWGRESGCGDEAGFAAGETRDDKVSARRGWFRLRDLGP